MIFFSKYNNKYNSITKKKITYKQWIQTLKQKKIY